MEPPVQRPGAMWVLWYNTTLFLLAMGGVVKRYELIMVLDPNLDEERAGSVVERVKRFVGDHGGAWTKEDKWGRRKLAYPIRTFSEGTYYLADVEMDSAPAKELEQLLNLSEGVIRYLVVRREQKAPASRQG